MSGVSTSSLVIGGLLGGPAGLALAGLGIMSMMARQDQVEHNVSQEMKKSRQMQNAITDMEAAQRKARERQAAQQRQIDSLSEDLKEEKKRSITALDSQRRKFDTKITQLKAEIKSDYMAEIRAESGKLRQSMDKMRNELKAEVSRLSDRLAARELNEKDQASFWLNQASQTVNVIDQHYRHSKFRPGVLSKLKDELLLNQKNFDNKMYQAALSGAQQAYLRVEDLRLELEQQEQAWEEALFAARHSTAQALAYCNAQQMANYILQTETGNTEIQAEVDFWTDGALSKIRQQAEAAEQQLCAPENLTQEQLSQFINQGADSKQQTERLVEQAKQALVASQLRNNIGQTIEQSLTDMGWNVEDAAYNGEDMRKALHVKLKNLQGDEMVAIVNPEKISNNEMINQLTVHFFDRTTNDEQFRQARMNSILEQLRQEGIEASSPKCQPGTENAPSRDLRQLDFDKLRIQTPEIKS